MFARMLLYKNKYFFGIIKNEIKNSIRRKSMKTKIKFLAVMLLVVGAAFVCAVSATEESTVDSQVITVGNVIHNISYDTATKTLSLACDQSSTGYKSLNVLAEGEISDTEHKKVINFLDTYRAETEYFELSGYSKIQLMKNGKLFADMVNLKEIWIKDTGSARIAANGSQWNWARIGLFSGCTNLKTLYIGDESARKENCIDLSDFNAVDFNSYFITDLFENCSSATEILLPEDTKFTGIDTTTFSGCASLQKVSVPSAVTTLDGEVFKDLTALTAVVFNGDTSISSAAEADSRADIIMSDSANTFSGCESLAVIVAANGSAPAVFAEANGLVHTDNEEHVFVSDGKSSATKGIVILFDDEDNSLLVTYVGTASSASLTFCYHNTNTAKRYAQSVFIKQFESLVTSVRFEKINSFTMMNIGSPFSGMTNLTTVSFSDNIKIIANASQYDYSSAGLFEGAANLKTVYCGEYSAQKEGIVDLSGVTFGNVGDKNPNRFRVNTFKNSGAEYVILPAGFTVINANTFNNCKSLKTVTVPVDVTEIANGAFDTCSSLERINLLNPSFADTEDKIFPESDILKIVTVSRELKNSFNYEQTTLLPIVDTVKADGFSIRLNGDNGLRTLFSFDETLNTNLSENGFELKEYGAVLISKKNLDSLGSNFELKIVNINDKYVVNATSAVKMPVYSGGDKVGSILSSSNAAATKFAATLVNYTSNFFSDVYSFAYSVYTDNYGNEFIEYANYGTKNPDLTYVNICDLAISMYTNNPASDKYASLLSNSMGTKAVWNTLYQGAAELDGNKITELNGAKMIAVEKNGTKYAIIGAPTKAAAEAAVGEAIEKAGEAGVTIDAANTVAICVSDIETESVFEGIEVVQRKINSGFSSPLLSSDKTTDKAGHPQGMTADSDGNIYVSYSGVVVKYDINGEETARFTPPDELYNASFHLGDIAYHNGKIYGCLFRINTVGSRSFVAILDADNLDNLRLVNLPEAYYSAAEDRYLGISGVDGVTAGRLPGKGYIDADGNEHIDNNMYLLVSYGGGVATQYDVEGNIDDRYDNDIYTIAAYSFDKLNEMAVDTDLLSFFTSREKTSSNDISPEHKIHFYLGSCWWGAQTMAYDSATGDIIFNTYNRGKGTNVYPSVKAVVIDGSKKLCTGELEVGQSSSNESAQEIFNTVYGGIAPTGLIATLKCQCEKHDIEAHEAISYGDTGYAFRLCSGSIPSYSKGCVYIGNDLYYILSQLDGTDANGTKAYGAKITVQRLDRYEGAWKYVTVE